MFEKLTKIFIVAACALCVSGSGVTFAYNEAFYNEAISSIENYNKGEALSAAISAVDAQIPNFAEYYDMSFAPNEINGKICNNLDIRYPKGGIGCGWDPKTSLIFQLGTAEGYITKADTEYDPETDTPSQLANKSFVELISLAKTSSAYTNDAEFKQFVDECETGYNRGVNSLRTNLPKVDATLTNLDTKTGAELLALYENLPAVKAGTYDELFASYNHAFVLKAAFEQEPDAIGLADQLADTYGALVANAKVINSNFVVDLSALASTAPTAPDTGTSKDEELSVTIAKVALTSIGILAAGTGAAVVAKRYIFSPLKRRK